MNDSHSDWMIWLRDQRHRAINLILGMVLIVGCFGIAISFVTWLQTGGPALNLPYLLSAYAILLGIFLARGWSDDRRGQVFLAVLFLFSLYALRAGWLVSSGRTFLLSMIVVATFLVGPRAGIVATVASLATYAGFGWAYHRGWFQMRPLPDPTDLPPVLFEGVGFALAVGMVAASQWFFGRALRAASQANQEAQEARRELAERTAQLEAANHELEAFTSAVSHDLRAPLRAINGFSQMLLEDNATRLDDVGRGHLERIRGNTRQMGQLVDGLLRLSRLSRGEMHLGPVDLSALVAQKARELHERQPERSVDFRIAPALVVRGDPTLLQVVIHNLLDNAWKFTSRQPCARIEFGVEESHGTRVFLVRDNGAGFDMAHADKLFGAFQRLHSEREFTGTGIGLATVARILRRHGGRIWAVGTPGQGATFYFTLPPAP